MMDDKRMANDSKHSMSPRQPAADVANYGVMRPPLVYLASIGLGLLVHRFWPVQFLPASGGVSIGVVAALVAVALFISAVRALRKAGTPVPGNRPATAVVRTGPFRFTRNPIYLAFTLFQIGIAASLNSLGLLLTLVPALAIMAVVIRREERYLEARFAKEYLPYKRAVRRWL